VRTTINIDEELLARVKEAAAARSQSVSEVIAEAVRTVLLVAEPPMPPYRLVTFGGSGPRPGVDLARTSALFEEDDRAQFGGGAGGLGGDDPP
jgi:hypothetical protein